LSPAVTKVSFFPFFHFPKFIHFEGREVLRDSKGQKGEKEKVRIYESKDGKITHMFLAREGSEAGEKNESTFEFLRTYFCLPSPREKDQYLRSLLLKMRDIADDYFQTKLTKVELFYSEKEGEFLLRAIGEGEGKLILKEEFLELSKGEEITKFEKIKKKGKEL
jgi:hypothetical protein